MKSQLTEMSVVNDQNDCSIKYFVNHTVYALLE